MWQFTIFALLFMRFAVAAVIQSGDDDERVIVLVPHGDDPHKSKDRIVIPEAKDGRQPPLPCVISGVGTHEHGQTFTKNNFHYNCNNGTAEVIACVTNDMSVIQIGRTFLRHGIRHKCNVVGDTVTYEQSSTCFENGVHYDVGETFRNGSFKIICRENGVAIQGCYVQNSSTEVIPLGGSQIIGTQRHSCELLEGGKIRYIINLLGCRKGNEMYREGQMWTDKHIRYQCTNEGITKVLGCIDEGGLFVDLGRDILMQGIVHRCYKLNSTTVYHRFQCDAGKSLQECVNKASVPGRMIRSTSIRRKRNI